MTAGAERTKADAAALPRAARSRRAAVLALAMAIGCGPVARAEVDPRVAEAEVLGAYMSALHHALARAWMRPDSTQPGMRCAVLIEQDPRGNVLGSRIVEPCNADDSTRRSIEAAVLRAQPLPHRDFEAVWQREITFLFRFDGP